MLSTRSQEHHSKAFSSRPILVRTLLVERSCVTQAQRIRVTATADFGLAIILPPKLASKAMRLRGRCPKWVKRVGFVVSAVRPVHPKQQTFLDPVGTSHLGHKRTQGTSAARAPNDRSCSVTWLATPAGVTGIPPTRKPSTVHVLHV
jgi:hypothetical protein